MKSRRRELGGMGLISMEERLRMLGSKFSLTSGPGQGTRLYFEINRTPKPGLPGADRAAGLA